MARDGKVVPERIEQAVPDAMILDLTCNRLDGGSHGRRPGDMLTRGFDGYLSKPFGADLFHQSIQEEFDGK